MIRASTLPPFPGKGQRRAAPGPPGTRECMLPRPPCGQLFGSAPNHYENSNFSGSN